MARAKLSALLTDLTGRYGGGVFRSWKGITTLSALPSSVENPNTAKQSDVRAMLSYASKLWAGLGSAARNDWEAVAAYLSEQWNNLANEVGSHRVIRTPRGPFTAIGAMTSVVNLLYSIGDFALGDAAPSAPISVTAPMQPTALALSGDTSGLVVTWTDPDTWGNLGHPGAVRIWVKSDDGVFFPQLSVSEDVAVETTTITELVPRGGGAAVSLTEGYYFVQADAVNAEGLRSAPSAVAEIALDAPV